MTPAGLHPGLQSPLQQCETTREELLSLVRGLTRKDWNLRRSSEEWSIGLLVDHLIRAEVGTSKMAARLIRGDFAGLERPAAARLYDSTLSVYPYGRFPAPAGLLPQPLQMEDALGKLETVHRRFVDELLCFQGPDADGLASEDQDTGWWFTLAGWVRLQALHEEHHITQIRGLLAVQ